MTNALKAVENSELVATAERVVTTIRHVGVVRDLAVTLTGITGNAYACVCGCGYGSFMEGATPTYGSLVGDDGAIRPHNDSVDTAPGVVHS